MTFTTYSLDDSLLKAITEASYNKPTEIQCQAIPLILAKHDVMARAQTGTGKTAAFALPLLQQIISDKDNIKKLSVLVLTPTRELAQQVFKSFSDYGKYTDISMALAYGGVSVKAQAKTISAGINILVATPGRLLDHLHTGTVSLNDLQVLVFDEADRMLDMGFKDEIDRILVQAPLNRQTLLFSATFDDDIYNISKKLLTNAKQIEIENKNSVVNTVEQVVYTVDADRKRELTSYLIGSKNWQQVLIFTRTKLMADMLAKEMSKDGIKSLAIHGDKSQGARDKALTFFKEGKIRALIATDVAARGIDISDLYYVINYELPYQSEDYVHRIGRTARAGKSGLAVSLVSPDEEWLLKPIEELLSTNMLKQWLSGFEPDLTKLTDSPKSHTRKPSKKSARQKALTGNTNEKSKRSKRYRK
jgi:superfamily II DNA/RNA helicase